MRNSHSKGSLMASMYTEGPVTVVPTWWKMTDETDPSSQLWEEAEGVCHGREPHQLCPGLSWLPTESPAPRETLQTRAPPEQSMRSTSLPPLPTIVNSRRGSAGTCLPPGSPTAFLS